MARRNGRRVWLGFQWDAGSWDAVPIWGESLLGAIQNHVAHWVLPAFPLDMAARKRASAARILRPRIEKNKDPVFSRGFAGACHPLLSIDELERELSWGVKNPWATGIGDVFDVRPSVLVPALPDLARPAAWEAYRSHGFTTMGLSAFSIRPRTVVPAGCFCYTRVRASGFSGEPSDTRRLRRLLSSGSDLFLMVELSDLSNVSSLEALMREVAPVLEGQGPFPADAGATTAPTSFPLDWSPFPPPRLRAMLSATAALARRKRKRTEEYADLLGRLAMSSDPAPDVTPAAGRGHERRLVAHMLGEVSLAGSDFDVRLAGGRFCGATLQGRDLLPRRAAQSYLRVAGKTLEFKTTSSFSFEGDTGTGLREELRLAGRESAFLSLEYAFCDDSAFLTVSGRIRYPDLPAKACVEEYAPLAIALRELHRGETVRIEAVAPDESAAVASIGEASGPVFLPGASFRIPRADGGWIVLRFSALEDRAWGLPSFRLTRTRGARVLEVNPFGSYAPTAGNALSGREETFGLLLNLEDRNS